MTTTVGVLCARVRMEEKWLIEALAEAGVAVSPLPPSPTPLPVGPVPSGPLATTVAGGVAAPSLIIDRLADRTLAGAIMPVMRVCGSLVVDGGLAASGNRYAIASALAVAGLPRPATVLVTSEDAGLAAVAELGCPATMLPLELGAPELTFHDRDIAEAVLEHREVLGGSHKALALIQAGGGTGAARTEVAVINGRAIAASEIGVRPAELRRAAELAEATAVVLGATVLGVSIAQTGDGAVVWDVHPVPEFRAMTLLGSQSVAGAITNLVMQRLTSRPAAGGNGGTHPISGELMLTRVRGEAADGVILSA